MVGTSLRFDLAITIHLGFTAIFQPPYRFIYNPLGHELASALQFNCSTITYTHTRLFLIRQIPTPLTLFALHPPTSVTTIIIGGKLIEDSIILIYTILIETTDAPEGFFTDQPSDNLTTTPTRRRPTRQSTQRKCHNFQRSTSKINNENI